MGTFGGEICCHRVFFKWCLIQCHSSSVNLHFTFELKLKTNAIDGRISLGFTKILEFA